MSVVLLIVYLAVFDDGPIFARSHKQPLTQNGVAPAGREAHFPERLVCHTNPMTCRIGTTNGKKCAPYPSPFIACVREFSVKAGAGSDRSV